MIPKVIHYCWFGGNPLPREVKKCIASWKKFAPDYEIIEWNESNFDIHCHSFVETAYQNKAWAFVSDYARLKIVYDNGGIYFDTDVELIKSPEFLLNNKCYVGIDQNDGLCATGLGFGAMKHSPIVELMMKKYDNVLYTEQTKEMITCPILNHDIVQKEGYMGQNDIWESERLTVYPARYFDPFPSGRGKNLLCADTVSIHHYSASWKDGKIRLKRKFARLIGEKNVLAIKKILRKC